MYKVMMTKEFKVSKAEAEKIFEDQAALYNKLLHRITEKRDRVPKLSLSMIGKADRQIYYELNAYDKEQLLPHTLNKFAYGDVIELNTLLWAKLAGYRVENEQGDVSICGVNGHMDCTINGIVVDVKSTSTYGFKKFKEGDLVSDDPFGYIGQISAYHQAYHKDKWKNSKAAFLAMDKQNGHLCVSYVDPKDMIDAEARVKYLLDMVVKKEVPTQCCGGTKTDKMGNTQLSTACSYCPFKKVCHPELRTFIYSTGPVHLTKVVKQPNVFEVK